MQPVKPVRIPLTVVGIVSNVVALVLVCVLLNEGNDFKLPSLRQLAKSIEQIAKTKKVMPDDLRKILGEPGNATETKGFWRLSWYESDGGQTGEKVSEQELTIYDLGVEEKEGRYVILLVSTKTYKRGLRYLYGNAVQAIRDGSLFRFVPYRDVEHRQIILTVPK